MSVGEPDRTRSGCSTVSGPDGPLKSLVTNLGRESGSGDAPDAIEHLCLCIPKHIVKITPAHMPQQVLKDYQPQRSKECLLSCSALMHMPSSAAPPFLLSLFLLYPGLQALEQRRKGAAWLFSLLLRGKGLRRQSVVSRAPGESAVSRGDQDDWVSAVLLNRGSAGCRLCLYTLPSPRAPLIVETPSLLRVLGPPP